MHKFSPWCDEIGIKFKFIFFQLLIIKLNFISPFIFNPGLPYRIFFCISCGPKSTSSLLVLFCSRCYTVNCKINQFSWIDKTNYFISISENIFKNFIFRTRLWSSILWMGTWVNNTVHVKIKIVNLRIIRSNLFCNFFASFLLLI